jgi:2-haloacid dehalogenase
MYKPRPEIYQHAVASLGVSRDEIGFVSSNYWDIAGATSFGFRTYWLNRGAGTGDELGFTPSAIFATLTELPRALT